MRKLALRFAAALLTASVVAMRQRFRTRRQQEPSQRQKKEREEEEDEWMKKAISDAKRALRWAEEMEDWYKTKEDASSAEKRSSAPDAQEKTQTSITAASADTPQIDL